MTLRRRQWLAAMLAIPMLGFIRPETLPIKRARFEEIGHAVVMTVPLPGLFRRTDSEALASIDSGFDTRLVFTLRVWEHGSRRLVDEQTVTVKVRRDPWKKRYIVRTKTERGWVKREFDKRDAALRKATTLERVRIVAASELVRGSSYYFVEILALRNPLQRTRAGTSRWSSGGGRDLEWFERIVAVVAGERPEAEEIIHLRTNPFFLLER